MVTYLHRQVGALFTVHKGPATDLTVRSQHAQCLSTVICRTGEAQRKLPCPITSFLRHTISSTLMREQNKGVIERRRVSVAVGHHSSPIPVALHSLIPFSNSAPNVEHVKSDAAVALRVITV